MDEFKAAIGEPGFVAIDCYAEWCGPCKVISPKFHEMAKHHPQLRFYQVDVDGAPDVAQELSIRAMPTFKFFHNGEVADEIVGANPAKLLEAVKNGVEAVKEGKPANANKE